MEYHAGDAPALIINHTDHVISFWEKGNVNERFVGSIQFPFQNLTFFCLFLSRTLNPSEKMLYTWADPAGDRLILWNDGDKHVENDLRRDGIAPFK